MTIILPPDLESPLADAAQRQGTTPERLALDVLREKFIPNTGQPRVAGLHPGAIQISHDFDEPLPDEFWTGSS